ncbi:MAG: DUF6385 domain-containing protein [Gorillibacterium sp.]|nr:DUF6385 domain-containing protein [Gorillibacterium sp.]
MSKSNQNGVRNRVAKCHRKPLHCCHKRFCKPVPVTVKVRVQVEQMKFVEKERLNIDTTDKWQPYLSLNSALLSTYTYAIHNRGEHPAQVMLEVSPNGVDYMPDAELTVPAGSMQLLTPMQYLKYIRIRVKSKQAGQSTVLDLYFQAQSA